MDLMPWMQQQGMLPAAGETVLCAVSGGRDSVCLLHYLASLGRRRGFAVAAAPRASAPSIAGLSMLGRSGVCFSHNDLMTGVGVAFAAAAAAGPEATMAALVALSTAVGGVPGGVLGTIVSLLSVPTAASIAKKTVVAVATGRGVGIKVVFDYPPVQAVYC